MCYYLELQPASYSGFPIFGIILPKDTSTIGSHGKPGSAIASVVPMYASIRSSDKCGVRNHMSHKRARPDRVVNIHFSSCGIRSHQFCDPVDFGSVAAYRTFGTLELFIIKSQDFQLICGHQTKEMLDALALPCEL